MNTTEIVTLVVRYEALLEAVEASASARNVKALKDFLKKYPGIRNYDDRGNWIGFVSNENGWTP